jgi:2-polyprenyl-3-methyl-5-hydroxy-6-metoxy-1,4-benzoquinol methylase
MNLWKKMPFKLQKNTAAVWDKVYKNTPCEKEDRYIIEKEKHSLVWKQIKKRIIDSFGSFKGLKTIEIGAGRGTYSILFALEGADVTVLDYSQKAIDSSRLFFKRNNVNASFVKGDALKIGENLISKFDVSMSFGTAEHFLGTQRIDFIENHFKMLKNGGIAFISAPNKWNFFYRLWKFLSQSLGRWKFGEEYPFSTYEFKKIGRKINKKIEILGGYLFDSQFQFLKRIRKFLKIKESYNIKDIHNQIKTPLDKYFSRVILAVGKN